jgi:TrbL/VirB6 plasmid conjugal transfer protein
MGVLDSVLSDFKNAGFAYQPLLVVWALRILTATTFLGGAIMMVETAKRRDFAGMMDALFMGLLRIGIVYAVLANALPWGQGIIDLCTNVGEGVSGLSTLTLTPSGIVDLGTNTAKALSDASSYMLMLHPIETAKLDSLGLIVRFVWDVAAIIYLYVLVQCVWAVAVGPIVLSFSTLQYTWACLFVWFEGMLTIGIKLMATLLMLAIGETEASGWGAGFHSLGITLNLDPITNGTLALVEAVVFATLLWVLPYAAHRMVKVHMGSGMTWNDAGAASLLAAGKKTASVIGKAAVTAARTAARMV